MYNDPGLAVTNGCMDPERPRFWSPTIPNCGAGVCVQGVGEGMRGYRWAVFSGIYGSCQTILPPNRELVFQTGINSPGTLPVGSRHQGGAHVLMGDGAVIFMTDSVEAGNSHGPTVYRINAARDSYLIDPTVVVGGKSPFGLWGALGTRASSETIEEQLNQ